MNELLEALNFDKERGGNDGLAAYLDSTPIKNVRTDIHDLLTKERLAVLTSVEKMLLAEIPTSKAQEPFIKYLLRNLTTLKP